MAAPALSSRVLESCGSLGTLSPCLNPCCCIAACRDLAEQNWVEAQMSSYGVLTKSYWLGYYRATTSSTAPWYSDDDPLTPVVPQPLAGPRNADPYRHWCAAAAAGGCCCCAAAGPKRCLVSHGLAGAPLWGWAMYASPMTRRAWSCIRAS